VAGAAAFALLSCRASAEPAARPVPTSPAAIATPVPTEVAITPSPIVETRYGEKRTRRLEPGECFLSGPTTDEGELLEYVELIPCSDAWDFRVLNTFELSAPSTYPGKSDFERSADTGCQPGTTVFLSPTRRDWAEGDRTIICLTSRG
jgi:hypothetical protein